MQYASTRGIIIIDSSDELFGIFHLLMVNAISAVAESFFDDRNVSQQENEYLTRWGKCYFSGAETFMEACKKLKAKNYSIREYMNFIMKIPLMSSFLCIKSIYQNQIYVATFIMTLDNFCQMTEDNYTSIGDTSLNRSSKKNKKHASSAESRKTEKRNNFEKNFAHDNVHVQEDKKQKEAAWKARFYELYEKIHCKMSNSTLLSKDRYYYILGCLKSIQRKGPKQKSWSLDEKRFNGKYKILTNVKDRCIYRRNKIGEWVQVTFYEEVWDLMHSSHQDLSHTRDFKKNKTALDKVYYKIPEQCIRLFLKLCPICFSARFPSKKSKMNPLKFIHSPRVGHRAQVDTILMDSVSVEGYNHVLRYVDHLSGYSHVALLRTKEAHEVGDRLIEIISTCIMPEILQSDNGSEFLGYCISKLQEHYGNIHIVKGRARHPQSQGKVERGHASFKENLQKWMKEHPGKSWALGAYVVNGQMNQIPQYNRGGFSAYNLYYGKHCTKKTIVVFGEVAANHAKTEFGVHSAKAYCLKARKLAPDREVTTKEIVDVIERGTLFYCKIDAVNKLNMH
jgi:hypothetical protein